MLLHKAQVTPELNLFFFYSALWILKTYLLDQAAEGMVHGQEETVAEQVQ